MFLLSALFAFVSGCGAETRDATTLSEKSIPKPNYIMSKYTLENQHLLRCRENVSEEIIRRNLNPNLSIEGRDSYFLFELGLCYSLHGNQTRARLQMYRVANYSSSYDLNNSAKLLALEYMALDDSNLYDFLWSNQILDDLQVSANVSYEEFAGQYKLTMHRINVIYAIEKLQALRD